MLYSCLLSVSATCFAGGSAAPQLHAWRSGTEELRAVERKRKACRGHKMKKPGMKSGL